MKKLVTILGSIGLIATTGITVVACKTPTELKSKLEKPKEEHNSKNSDKIKDHIENEDNNNSNEQDVQGDQPKPGEPINSISEETEESKSQDRKDNLSGLEEQPRESKKPENSSNSSGNPSEEQPQTDEPQVQGGEQPQNDQPIENEEQQKRDKNQNFELIKRYGEEFTSLLSSSMDRDDNIDNEKYSSILTTANDLKKAYETIKGFSDFNSFEAKLKETLDSEFINRLEHQWDKIVSDYEKVKDEIFKLLKK
ncbi:hypothetical protein MFERI14815_00590 [Mycoplasma feriruminatoris]|uniref:lipoprotein n=1 Tax=Mycoplasma feriruminatoris TaxID=1179777 RepID=UPI00241D71C8|nr:lipoprotein [Mycoplasma feriruminatoris]WFQ91974.1 hypothetical protein MFERI14815_00590 [Mycoplasma feriruminatoris]